MFRSWFLLSFLFYLGFRLFIYYCFFSNPQHSIIYKIKWNSNDSHYDFSFPFYFIWVFGLLLLLFFSNSQHSILWSNEIKRFPSWFLLSILFHLGYWVIIYYYFFLILTCQLGIFYERPYKSLSWISPYHQMGNIL